MKNINSITIFQSAQSAFKAGNFAKAIEIANQLKHHYTNATSSQTPVYSASENSICIVTYKYNEETQEIVRSLASYMDGKSMDMILVSNGPEDYYTEIEDEQHFPIKRVITGYNYGCSGGRNYGIGSTSSKYITFIDDDGQTDIYSLKALLRCAKKYDAVAVRGKVIPKTKDSHIPNHYDAGESVIPHITNCEGISIWKTESIKLHYFDPNLYGHEGVELGYKLLPKYGHNKFLYTPNSILYHDYDVETPASNQVTEKQQRYKHNLDYLKFKIPNYSNFLKSFNLNRGNLTSKKILDTSKKIFQTTLENCTPLTYLTTVHNGRHFVEQYVESLRSQTCKDFKVVCVDDGSTDGTDDLLEKILKDDDRFQLIKTDHIGRAEALNLALSYVKTELAAIADFDDISVMDRTLYTLKLWSMHNNFDCIGGNIFNHDAYLRSIKPFCTYPLKMSTRRVFGMPAPFPAFSFRPDRFPLPFDKNMTAGIDMDWIHRNFNHTSGDGLQVPLHFTYYNVHDGQITSTKRDLQRHVSITRTKEYHETLLGHKMPEIFEEAFISFLGWGSSSTAPIDEVTKYLVYFIEHLNPEYVTKTEVLSQLDIFMGEFKIKTLSDQAKSNQNDFADVSAKKIVIHRLKKLIRKFPVRI